MKLPARDCETESPPRHPQGGELRAAPYHAALERVESTGGSVEEAPKTKPKPNAPRGQRLVPLTQSQSHNQNKVREG